MVAHKFKRFFQTLALANGQQVLLQASFLLFSLPRLVFILNHQFRKADKIVKVAQGQYPVLKVNPLQNQSNSYQISFESIICLAFSLLYLGHFCFEKLAILALR